MYPRTFSCTHDGLSRHAHVSERKVVPRALEAPSSGVVLSPVWVIWVENGPPTWAVQGKLAVHKAAGCTLEDAGSWLVPWEGDVWWPQRDRRCNRRKGVTSQRDRHSPQGGMQAGAGGGKHS